MTYTVYQNGTALISASNLTAATAIITGLNASTGYDFTVVATNSVGSSDPSDALTVTTSAFTCDAAPSVPANLAASNITTTSMTLSWAASTNAAHCSTLTYTLYEGGTAIATATDITDLTVDLSGLTPGTAYSYTVLATNEFGPSDQSDPPVDASTLASCVATPATPANLTVLGATSNAATMSWDAVDPVPNCTVTYTVNVDGWPMVTGLTSPATTITGLASDTPHSITVTADDELGSSAETSAETATTTVDPYPVGYDAASLGVPQYECKRNFFISPTGSDANDGLTPATAWFTIGDRNAGGANYVHGWNLLTGGDCVNLLDGEYDVPTYAYFASDSSYGTENSPTGYLVWRSVSPHGAHIKYTGTDATGAAPYLIYSQMWYAIIDGFEVDGNGMQANACVGDYWHSFDHVVYENMYVHDCSGQGMQIMPTDYSWIVNNTLSNNGSVATGSSSALYFLPGNRPITTPAYGTFTPNAADLALTYRNVIAFNTIDGNENTTDNSSIDGIFMGDFPDLDADAWNGASTFDSTILILGNQIYNNGGLGIDITHTPSTSTDPGATITVANNSTYNNNLNTDDASFTNRGEIGVSGSTSAVSVINNAALATSTGSASNVAYTVDAASTSVTFTTNIGTPAGITDSGITDADPLFTDAANGDFSLDTATPSLAIGAGTAESWLTAAPPNMGWWQNGAVPPPPPPACMFVPATPTGLAASNLTAAGVTMSWSASAFPPNCTVTYTLYQDGNAVASATDISALTADITGLVPETPYSYTVSASDAKGESAQSAAVSVTTLASACTGGAPAVPATVTVWGTTANAMTLSWDVDPASSDDCPVTYSVYAGTDMVASGLASGATTVTGLAPDTPYDVTVVATNELGSSTSATASITTTADPTPAGYNLDALGIPQYTCSRNFFVSPDGDDANDGLTPATPWLTMGDRSEAASAASQGNDNPHGWQTNIVAGTCVNLLDGEYDIAHMIMFSNGNSSGTDNSPTGYVVYRAVNPVSSATHATIKFTGASTQIYPTGNYSIFDGMEVDGGSNASSAACFWGGGGTSQNNHHIVYENMYIHDCGRAALRIQEAGYIWVVNSVLANNEIATGGNAEGAIFEMPGGAIATNQSLADTTFTPNAADDALTNGTIIFAFNSIHDNGMAAEGDDGIQVLSVGANFNSDTILIVGNQIYSNAGRGVTSGGGSGGTFVTTIANNSFYNNNTCSACDGHGEIGQNRAGINSINNAALSVITVNTNNVSIDANSGPGTGTIASTNFGYPNTGRSEFTTGDPMFTDPASADFSLQSGSAAYQAGAPEPWLTNTTDPNAGQWQGTL